jgi:hypothetical protein
MDSLHGINLLSLIIGIGGLATAILMAFSNYFNKGRFKASSDASQDSVNVFKDENAELRNINLRQKAENSEILTKNRVLIAEATEKDNQIQLLKQLNSQQPNYEKLMSLMTNNHKDVMLKLTDIVKGERK